MEKMLKEEHLLELKHAVEIMQLGVTITNLEGTIIYTNRAEAEMHGYEVEELLDKDVGILAPRKLRSPLTLEQIKEWKGLIRESTNIRKDGSSFPVWLMSEIVKGADGEPSAIVTSCEDITERKALEEERRRYRDHLEDLVKERTTELTSANTQLQQEINERKHIETALHQAKEAAESANRAKSDFLANMSHELRTPLNGILGYAQILQSDITLSDLQRRAINIIRESGEHLLMMIGDILDLSKIEAGKMKQELSDFHLPSLLISVVELAQIRAKHKGIEFTYYRTSPLPESVCGDEKHLRQILLNLLGNAVKFTEQGRVVFTVSCPETVYSYQKQSFVRIRFHVEDTGIGISQEHLEHIFSAFYQAGDIRPSTEGTGLGLAISQRLVRMMGGELYVESIVGRGSTFWFEIELPVAETVQPKQRTFPKTQRIIGYEGDKEYTALLADDNEANRVVLKDLLAPLGFNIIESQDGRDTLNKTLIYSPDFILMDMVMPRIDGLKVTRQLRAISTFKDLVIIAISASVSDQKQQECIEAGCNHFLSKPFHIEELLEILRRYLALEWHYLTDAHMEDEHQGNTEDSNQATDTSMVCPSQKELSYLYLLAKSGRLSRLRKYVHNMQANDPKLTPFAKKICQFIQDFKVKKIQEFVQHYMEEERNE